MHCRRRCLYHIRGQHQVQEPIVRLVLSGSLVQPKFKTSKLASQCTLTVSEGISMAIGGWRRLDRLAVSSLEVFKVSVCTVIVVAYTALYLYNGAYHALCWKDIFKSFHLIKRNPFGITLLQNIQHFFNVSKLLKEYIDIQGCHIVKQIDLHRHNETMYSL